MGGIPDGFTEWWQTEVGEGATQQISFHGHLVHMEDLETTEHMRL
jgi:hypothetical protein